MYAEVHMTALCVIVVDGTIDTENCSYSIPFSPRDNHEEPNFPISLLVKHLWNLQRNNAETH